MSYAILAIASPSDGVGSLRRICSNLPQHLPIPVACLQQFVSGVAVEDIIPRASALCARYGRAGESLEPGCVLFSPPGRGLVVTPERTFGSDELSAGSCDRFLKSVAETYGPQALVVLLSGWGADGIEGAHAVKDAGGTLIAQLRAGMPFRDATQLVTRTRLADETLDAARIASALTRRIFGAPRPTSSPHLGGLRPV